jgi:hypothetical protein
MTCPQRSRRYGERSHVEPVTASRLSEMACSRSSQLALGQTTAYRHDAHDARGHRHDDDGAATPPTMSVVIVVPAILTVMMPPPSPMATILAIIVFAGLLHSALRLFGVKPGSGKCVMGVTVVAAGVVVVLYS